MAQENSITQFVRISTSGYNYEQWLEWIMSTKESMPLTYIERLQQQSGIGLFSKTEVENMRRSKSKGNVNAI
jgi:hypothetical protein